MRPPPSVTATLATGGGAHGGHRSTAPTGQQGTASASELPGRWLFTTVRRRSGGCPFGAPKVFYPRVVATHQRLWCHSLAFPRTSAGVCPLIQRPEGRVGCRRTEIAFQVEAEPGLLWGSGSRRTRASSTRPGWSAGPVPHSHWSAAGRPCGGAEGSDGGLEGGRTELLGVLTHDPLQPPATGGQVGGDLAGQGAGPGRRGVAAGDREQLLGVDRSAFAELGSGLVILGPLLASAAVAFLPG
jgi:hypothetical protein